MRNSSKRLRTILSAAVGLTSTLVASPSSVFAGELQKGTAYAVPRKQSDQPAGGEITRVSLTSGAPYICTPSGFGRKGACVLRAGL